MKKLLLLAFCSLNALASELIIKGGGFVPHKLGSLDLIRTDTGYEILKGGARTPVKDHDVDDLLRKLGKKKLAKFVSEGHGYTEISRLSNGDYKVRAHVRGNGGGPILAGIFYATTKAVAYGGLLAAAGAAVGATGGGALLVAGAGEALAVTGSGLVATAIASSTTATAVATTVSTGSMVVATGTGVATVVTGIEVAASGAFAIGLAIPFL